MVRSGLERLVQIPEGSVLLEGAVAISTGAHGVVLFAHGSVSSRYSPRNNFVAQVLREAGIGSLSLANYSFRPIY